MITCEHPALVSAKASTGSQPSRALTIKIKSNRVKSLSLGAQIRVHRGVQCLLKFYMEYMHLPRAHASSKRQTPQHGGLSCMMVSGQYQFAPDELSMQLRATSLRMT